MPRFVTSDREALFQRASDSHVTAYCNSTNPGNYGGPRQGAVLYPQPERPVGA